MNILKKKRGKLQEWENKWHRILRQFQIPPQNCRETVSSIQHFYSFILDQDLKFILNMFLCSQLTFSSQPCVVQWWLAECIRNGYRGLINLASLLLNNIGQAPSPLSEAKWYSRHYIYLLFKLSLQQKWEAIFKLPFGMVPQYFPSREQCQVIIWHSTDQHKAKLCQEEF